MKTDNFLHFFIVCILRSYQEEIKCLKAANRAASFQRHFMIYQQQEIERLHKATLTIRDRIQHNSPQLDQVFNIMVDIPNYKLQECHFLFLLYFLSGFPC